MHTYGSPDAVLASAADIFGVLAQLATPASRRSSRDRLDRETARIAISGLLKGVNAGPADSSQSVAARGGAGARAQDATATPARRGVMTAAGAESVSRVKRRQRCRCGGCRWCQDNARWNRIFNEQFADPAYYGSLVVRHGSTLSAPR